VQRDIKKVLAYSTVSQLGYLFLGLSTGAWAAAVFHLVTHAFFKALLFLGAGSVIHGMHEEQDMHKMGGLKRHMPATFLTFVAVLSIVGGALGLPVVLGMPHLLADWLRPVTESGTRILEAAHGEHELSHTTEWILLGVGAAVALVFAHRGFRAYVGGVQRDLD